MCRTLSRLAIVLIGVPAALLVITGCADPTDPTPQYAIGDIGPADG